MFVIVGIELVIFLLIISFFICFNFFKLKTRNSILILIGMYILGNVFMVWSNFGVICIRKDPNYIKGRRECFSNIRKIIGAVEMYNMDYSTMMTDLDLPILFSKGYLKESLTLPDGQICDYISLGDLTDEGTVYCVTHGSPYPPELTIKKYFEPEEKRKYDELISPYVNKIEDAKKEHYRKEQIEKNKFSNRLKHFFKNAGILYPLKVLFFPVTLHPLNS